MIALERQVSSYDANGEIVDHQCTNLRYASEYGKQHYYTCDTNCHKRYSLDMPLSFGPKKLGILKIPLNGPYF